MRFSGEYIEEVRARNDIVDVIGSYIKLTRRGSSYTCLCPFHNDKSPSMSVHQVRQTYHCFACGASGDVFSFVMEYDRHDFSEAVELLAKRAGMELPQQEDYTTEKRREEGLRARLFAINKEAAVYYFHRLGTNEGKKAVSYLRGRSLSDETIKNFGLGYADSGDGLYKLLKEKEYTDAELKESGLFVQDQKTGKMRSKFWNRVMFPIMDVNRRVIGFGGRVMGDGLPKYMNSPETKLFDKSNNLYGLHIAKTARKKKMILCEGYMDVISMHQAGFPNAIASLGTALTPKQCLLIKRYSKEALIMYDSDEAGVKAALRAVPMLREAGVDARVVNLKPYKDPDEFAKALGAAELQKRIDDAENGFLFEIRQLQKNYNTADPKGRSDFIHEISTRLMAFPDEIERNSYADSISAIYNIDSSLLGREVGKLAENIKINGNMPQRSETSELLQPVTEKKKITPGERAEKNLLGWMSIDRELCLYAKKYLTAEDFTEGINRHMAEALFRLCETDDFKPVSILNDYEDIEDKNLAAAILSSYELPDEKDRMRARNEVILAVKQASLERTMNSDTPDLQRFIDTKREFEALKKELS